MVILVFYWNITCHIHCAAESERPKTENTSKSSLQRKSSLALCTSWLVLAGSLHTCAYYS